MKTYVDVNMSMINDIKRKFPFRNYEPIDRYKINKYTPTLLDSDSVAFGCPTLTFPIKNEIPVTLNKTLFPLETFNPNLTAIFKPFFISNTGKTVHVHLFDVIETVFVPRFALPNANYLLVDEELLCINRRKLTEIFVNHPECKLDRNQIYNHLKKVNLSAGRFKRFLEYLKIRKDKIFHAAHLIQRLDLEIRRASLNELDLDSYNLNISELFYGKEIISYCNTKEAIAYYYENLNYKMNEGLRWIQES